MKVYVRQDKRFTKSYVRIIEVEDTDNGTVQYIGQKFTYYPDTASIYLNEHKNKLVACEKCGAPDGKVPLVPMGDTLCHSCREACGTCTFCKKNRNDCCC